MAWTKDPEAKPETTPEAEPEVKSDARNDVTREAEEANSEAKPETTPDATPELQIEVKNDVTSETTPEAEPEVKSDARNDVTREAEEANSEAKPENKNDVTREAEEATPEITPEVKSQANSDVTSRSGERGAGRAYLAAVAAAAVTALIAVVYPEERAAPGSEPPAARCPGEKRLALRWVPVGVLAWPGVWGASLGVAGTLKSGRACTHQTHREESQRIVSQAHSRLQYPGASRSSTEDVSLRRWKLCFGASRMRACLMGENMESLGRESGEERRASMDSDLEAFSHYPTDGSLAALANQPTAVTKYPNPLFLSY
ncbi:YSIRK signal domain/LPXTG anchor domain surface protein [Babesia caballi]|uniref:YSIRK signal domain/LPXTG anchor domain surface protein n=1 Tax=Babesia caballi TaxID=5871 RepID=A0AAV4LQ39_BABCB|nr:YSIRK signal domain/LPXTG anchor domain surface protein [Babesia caballi]